MKSDKWIMTLFNIRSILVIVVVSQLLMPKKLHLAHNGLKILLITSSDFYSFPQSLLISLEGSSVLA